MSGAADGRPTTKEAARPSAAERAEPLRSVSPGARRAMTSRFLLAMAPAMIGANLTGALVIFAYLSYLAPQAPAADDPTGTVVNGIVFAAYLGFAVLVGTVGSVILMRPLQQWLVHPEQDLGRRDRRRLLRLPAVLVRL